MKFFAEMVLFRDGLFFMFFTSLFLLNSSFAGENEWPAKVKEITYFSAADSTHQPALFYAPGTNQDAPLLVALHTWSGDYRQKDSIPYANWCIKYGWVIIHPNFRGPNKRPEATGSELVGTAKKRLKSLYPVRLKMQNNYFDINISLHRR